MVVVSMMETSVASVATGEEDAVVTSAAAAAHAAAAAAAHISAAAAGPRDANSASKNIPLGIESSTVSATSPRSSWPYETSTVNLHLPPPPASPRCDFSVR